MSIVLKAKIAGLFTSPNTLASIPDGALFKATNTVINDDGLLEVRPGFEARTGTVGASSVRIQSLGFHQGSTILAWADNATLYYSTTDGFSFGSFSGSIFQPATGTKVSFIPASGLTFVTTSVGMRWVGTDLTIGPQPTGCPAAQLVTASPRVHGTLIARDRSVAYRSTIVRYHDDLQTESAPSGRCVVTTRITSLIGGMTRTGGTLVTVSTTTKHGLAVADSFALTPGEANFPAGTGTVNTVIDEYTFTFLGAGANVSNTVQQEMDGGSVTPIVTCYLPAGLTADTYSLRLYRSNAAASASLIPSDDCKQCFEKVISSTDISNGFITINDNCPEAFLGRALYTSPTLGDGIEAANNQPPIATDGCYWQDRLWLANTTSTQRLIISLLGCGSPAGLQVGDTVTVGGQTYIGISGAPAANSKNFRVFTTGTPSQNIQMTAESLIYAIFTNAANTSIYASYLSTEQGTSVPGQLLFESRTPGSNTFTFYSSRVTAWSQNATLASPVSSQIDRNQHWLVFSKIGESESFPLGNFVPVGSKNSAILAIVGFRGDLLVFKTEGVFSVSPSLSVVQISSARLLAVDSICLFNEAVWALTNLGFGFFTPAGQTVVSTPIDKDIRDLLTEFNQPSYGRLTFACASESARRIMLWLPMAGGTSADTAYVYNIQTRAWTTWARNATCGVSHPTNGLLYLGRSDLNSIGVSKGQGSTPYVFADESYALQVTGTDLTLKTLYVLSIPSQMSVGDAIEWNTPISQRVWVQSIDTVNLSVTVSDAMIGVPNLSLTNMVGYKAIPVDVKWHGLDAGDPGSEKILSELVLLTAPGSVFTTNINVSTDIRPTGTNFTLTWPGYGQSTFGGGLFGDQYFSGQKISPANVMSARGNLFYVEMTFAKAFTRMRLEGLRAEFAPAGSHR